MKKIIVLFAAIICFFTLSSFAPPGDPGGAPGAGDPPVGDDPPVGAPIDGGAIALLVAGAAYGVKQMKEKKK